VTSWDIDDYIASADRARRLAHTTQEQRQAAMERGRAAGAKGQRGEKRS